MLHLLWILAAGNVAVLLLIAALVILTLRSLNTMTDNTAATAAAIEQIKADVAAERSQVASAIALLAGLNGALRDALAKASDAGATDDQLAELHALAGEIEAQTGELASAVTANTAPSSPAPAPGPAGFGLEPPELDSATVGQPYSEQLAPTGGVAPWSFSIADGALPPGLILGAGGAITGTPTQSGAFDVSIQAHDGNNAAGQISYHMAVDDAAPALQPEPPNPEPAPADGNGGGDASSGQAGDGSSAADQTGATGDGGPTGGADTEPTQTTSGAGDSEALDEEPAQE